jgi:hypothetical protein
MTKLGKRLIKAAAEAIAIARGEADPSTYRVHLPVKDNTGEPLPTKSAKARTKAQGN